MLLRVAVGLMAGGLAGFALNRVTVKWLHGACALTCNPYVSVGLGLIVGLLWALGQGLSPK